jgi:hypothetical protein
VHAACPSANLYHGSTSASLLTFLRDDTTRGQLMTAAQMLEQGLVPMSGEMGNSLNPGAPKALSACQLSHFSGAHEYAVSLGRRDHTLPEQTASARVLIATSESDAPHDDPGWQRHVVAAQRLLDAVEQQESARAALQEEQQALVEREFPVVYALDRELASRARFGGSDVAGEACVPSPVTAKSIHGVFVPAAEVGLVTDLLRDTGHPHIKVQALESLHAA